MTGLTKAEGTWWCQACQEHGDGPKFDLAARKHLEATGHSTITSWRPVPKPSTSNPKD